MMHFGYFETELHTRYPDHNLLIRNQSIPGNTPGFRPHSSRNEPWAFPGADAFNDEFTRNTGRQGHFPTPDEWISKFNPGVLIAVFGYSDSYRGPEGAETCKAELNALIGHARDQQYNDADTTRLVLVSPIACENLSDSLDLPDGVEENRNR